MQYKKTILLVEDDVSTLNIIKSLLMSKLYKVLDAQKGEEALRMRINYNPDLILLDLGLPDMDGMDVLKEVRRQSQTPVIVISARQDEKTKVEALDCGATDYVTKPFGSRELLSRIRNTIQIYEKLNSINTSAGESFSFGGFSINYTSYCITMDGRLVHLTPIEYKIVELLSRHAGSVLTHEQIINKIWGPNNCDIQVLRVNMANIRRKIERDPSEPAILITELGVGYRIGDPLRTPK